MNLHQCNLYGRHSVKMNVYNYSLTELVVRKQKMKVINNSLCYNTFVCLGFSSDGLIQTLT